MLFAINQILARINSSIIIHLSQGSDPALIKSYVYVFSIIDGFSFKRLFSVHCTFRFENRHRRASSMCALDK